MQRLIPKTRDVVLVGGGHPHALVLRRWGMRPLPGVRLTLIDPGPTTSYSGMLPGFVAGHYSREELEIDLVRLACFAGARLIVSHAEGVDLKAGTVVVAGRSPVGLDLLSLNIGIHGKIMEVPGFVNNGIAAKPLDAFAERWAAFRDGLESGSRASAVVIGAGVAGIELALAMRHGAAKRSADLTVTVVERSGAMSGLRPATVRLLHRGLAKSGVRIIEGSEVVEIEDGAVTLAGGLRIASDFILGASGPRPYSWLRNTELALTNGYVRVDAHLATVSIVDCESVIGSGSLPTRTLPSRGISIKPLGQCGDIGSLLGRIAKAFVALPRPIIGRIHAGAFLLDLRCLERSGDLAALIQQLDVEALRQGRFDIA